MRLLFARSFQVAVALSREDCLLRLRSLAAASSPSVLGTLRASWAALAGEYASGHVYAGCVTADGFRFQRPSLASSSSFWVVILGSVHPRGRDALVCVSVGYPVSDVVFIGAVAVLIFLFSCLMAFLAWDFGAPWVLAALLGVGIPAGWAAIMAFSVQHEARRFRHALVAVLPHRGA